MFVKLNLIYFSFNLRFLVINNFLADKSRDDNPRDDIPREDKPRGERRRSGDRKRSGDRERKPRDNNNSNYKGG